MLNKFFKTIHNKYSRFFKFIFFLRYLFAIFFVAITLFLSIPSFFNYEKKEKLIKSYLIKDFNFVINDYKNIKYKAFPVPRLEFKKVEINFRNSNTNLNVNSLKIYPNILNIYNYNNFEVRKIVFDTNAATLETSNFKIFLKQLLNSEKKISLNDLDIRITNENELVLRLENVYFKNFGYKKNFINGKIFGKKFKAELSNNLKSIKFKILNSGISADLFLDENTNKEKMTGSFKSKILNSKLKFNYEYNKKQIKIFNSYFRSKNLSFKNESLITITPFFNMKTNLDIEELNFKIFEKINLLKIVEFKDSIKKVNSKHIINYKSKKFSKNFVDDLNLQIDLVYGRIYYKKKFLLAENISKCEGSLNILEEYPLLYFDCSIVLKDKKKLLKNFSIKVKNSKDILKIQAKGNLNVLNKKINLNKISLDNNNLSKEDLKYFKYSFENILFDEGFLKIFSLKKIKNYILEII